MDKTAYTRTVKYFQNKVLKMKNKGYDRGKILVKINKELKDRGLLKIHSSKSVFYLEGLPGGKMTEIL